jgi:transposase
MAANMANILHAVHNTHASDNTKYHCLYMYFFMGLRKVKLANLFSKAEATIATWIYRFENGEGKSQFIIGVQRKQRDTVYHKYGLDKRKWLVELYKKSPTLYLDEAKGKFDRQFRTHISVTCVWVILKEAGLSWKVLERRAIQICERDIIRFCDELSSFGWVVQNLVFLDEVSANCVHNKYRFLLTIEICYVREGMV